MLGSFPRIALGDVKDQVEDKANPKPWYTADEKSSKISTEDLLELIQEYPLPKGWYARLHGLQEPANYGTRFETEIYGEQVKSGYRLPLHPFALRFFEHYHMAPRHLVPNGWRKLVGLIYVGVGDDYSHKPVPAGALIPPPPATSIESVPLEMASGSGKAPQRGFLGVLQKAKRKRKEKQPSVELPPPPKKTRVTHPERSLQIVERVSIDEDPIFCPRWTLRCNDIGMLDSQISEQHLVHEVLPRDKEMYVSGSKMLSRFEMARQVATEEAQQKRDSVREAEEASRRAEELSKQEADYLALIETLKRRLEWKRTDDGLEIYEMGFMKAKEMFIECFPDIPLADFVMPAVVSPSGETAMPSEVGDTAASLPPGEGPSGDAPEL
ncbi:hypothetical protein RJ639_038476 [Escallonia herrerae]|uniref:Transposase (putative) gypsy type domain-containing protein n=1 Tax=Escallonia herrerae TaxID=1293975 RepID=A0AA88X0H1_9ASTE|nr:hypothetical protein RJ639_038476 [Escallonia herrerae]